LIVREGLRHNKYGAIQKFNLGFEKTHATPQMITFALQLYFTGESFRNVQRFLKLQGVKMSHVAIYKWIKKYVVLIQGYLEKIAPKLSDASRR
jgi:putative transposase